MTSDGPKIDLELLAQVESSPRDSVPLQEQLQEAVAGAERELAPAPFPIEVQDPGLNFDEVIILGAMDSILFNQAWFPKTFRQSPADFHPKIYHLLEDPLARYINIQVCRDGAKTTILRAYSAKRIAYGLSRTILYIAISEPKAKQSVAWLKHQIETNTRFCKAFGLSRGKPWSDEHICIQHHNVVEGETIPINIIAFGINAGVRGVNLDDYRPDLIIIDDVMDDENSSTEVQREKIITRVLGALKESLSPASETPDAKLVLLNTPQDFEDISEEAKKDTQFKSAVFGCWTPETASLAIEQQESAWKERYPSEILRQEKRASIARNRYSIFAKEKECLLITPESCAFRAEHLRFFGPGEDEPEPPLHEMTVELIIDPVPPPSKAQLEKGLKDKDYEAFAAVGRWRNKYYLLESTYNRGHDPNWTVHIFFELCLRWRPRKVVVEAVAYQAVLAWILRQAMKRTGRYYAIEEFKDRREKFKRIVDGLSGPTAEGAFFCRRTHSMFISQFTHFPGKNPEGQHDDVLESVAIGVASLSQGYVGDVGDDFYKNREEEIPALEYTFGAP
jgi:hypothetical protein